MPDFSLENQYIGKVIGIDEAGRGPLAGPVIAAASLFLEQDIDFIKEINDSKKISLKKRQLIFNNIINHPKIIYGYGIISSTVIDEINIFAATKKAMLLAVNNLLTKITLNKESLTILTDGKFNMLNNKFTEYPIIKGDSKSYSIATASIIAKVVRDNLMQDLDQKFPHYNWKKNAGYGTKEHVNAIFTHGISPHHRKSFAPIKNLI